MLKSFLHIALRNFTKRKGYSILNLLGLTIGLSAYNVIQRTKEIGIRKVLGASTNHLLFILSRDFLLLVGFSFLIAGALAFSIALVTVGLQALKATLANPVKSLRTE